MKFFVTLAWLGLTSALLAESKFAVVRITDIYRDLPSTAEMQRNIKEQKEGVMLDKRAELLRTTIQSLQSLQVELQENKDQLDTENGKKMVRAYEIKRQEAQTLQEEFERFRTDEDKRINKEMVEAMRSSLERINAAAQQIAEEQNYTGVVDISGNSNTGVPFVLYVSEEQKDISDEVIDLLGEKAIGDEEPAEVQTETNNTGATTE
ncbi:OmpH family outer membrane protein [Luteolibacter sp. AS25]|uniref:OmpH family outer membrane protein n=1 Tax=Luteolibacter sp. AS25 TaxID=3135776 RepID=UPI00398B9000